MNQAYFGKTGDEEIEIWYEEGRQQMWEGFVLLISTVKLEVKKIFKPVLSEYYQGLNTWCRHSGCPENVWNRMDY